MLKKQIKTISLILPFIILISCRAKKVKDLNAPQAIAIRMIKDACKKRSEGLFEVIFHENDELSRNAGKTEGLEYYWVQGCLLEIEATRDDGYAYAFFDQPIGAIRKLTGFSDHPSSTEEVYNNSGTHGIGFDSSVRITKGQHFKFYYYPYGDTLLPEPFLVKHDNQWLDADLKERELILKTFLQGEKY